MDRTERESGPMCDGWNVCSCRGVVTRVYGELRGRGIPEISAFDTATRIYRLHHPEVPDREARFTISEWID